MLERLVGFLIGLAFPPTAIKLILALLIIGLPCLTIVLAAYAYETWVEPWLAGTSTRTDQWEDATAEAERLRRNLQRAQEEADQFIAEQRLKAIYRNDHF